MEYITRKALSGSFIIFFYVGRAYPKEKVDIWKISELYSGYKKKNKRNFMKNALEDVCIL